VHDKYYALLHHWVMKWPNIFAAFIAHNSQISIVFAKAHPTVPGTTIIDANKAQSE